MKRILYTFLLIVVALTQMGQDIEPFRNVMELGRGTAESIAWKPDGTSMLVGGSRGVWIYTPEFQQLGFKDLPNVKHVAWSPDASQFASVQAEGTLSLWKTDEYNQIFLITTLKNAGNPIKSIAWNSNLVAVLVENQGIEIWDAATYSLSQTYAGDFTAMAWNGEILAAGDSTGTITLPPTGEILTQNTGQITALTWNGDILASATDTGSLIFWSNGTILASPQYHTAPINSLAWHENRLASVSGDHFEGSELKIWENFTPIETVAGTADMSQVAWQGEKLAVLSEDHLVRIWNTTTGEPYAVLQGHMGSMDSVAWSPDGSEIASASSDGLVRIWHSDTGKILATLMGHTRGINAMAWSPDGEMLASAGWDNTVRVWMRGTGKIRTIFTGHTRRIWDIAWSPDGREIASASRDLTVQVWNAYTGEVKWVLTGAESDIQSVAWSGQIAGSTDNGVVLIWDSETGQLLHTLTEGHRYYVWSLAWRPHQPQLLTSSWHDGVMKLWNSDTGEILQTLNSTAVTAVAWNPTGTKLASASDDGSIRFWDMQQGGKTTRVINAHDAPIYSLEWRPDGSMLASASEDGTIRFWSN